MVFSTNLNSKSDAHICTTLIRYDVRKLW